ncbi:MAG: DUF1367 family protein, partial [Candidatus Omnitrophota bacterium]|nr:DUF1367 family protein [Candidatus Omnitrophota bacterium]
MNLSLTKTQIGLMPADPESDEYIRKLKPGQVIHGKFSKVRSYKFHRKYFALLNVGFENWNPAPIETRWGIPERNFDQFREQLTILAGYYETVFKLDGTFKLRAKSISFAKMDEAEFEKIYQSTIT